MKYAIVISVSKTKFGPVVFRGDLLQNITKAYKLGYNAVELAVKDPDAVNVKEVSKLLQEYNLVIPAIGTGQIYFDEGLSFSDKDEFVRNEAVDRVKKIINLAKNFNSSIIIGLIRGNIKDSENDFNKELEIAEKRMFECLEKCLLYSERYNTKFLLEPLIRYNSNIFNKIGDVSNFLNKFKEKIDVDRIGILADTYHMNVEESIVEDSFSRYIDMIRYIHFSDSNRLAPGYGHINFKEIFKILKKEKYNNVISFEILPVPNPDISAKDALEYVKNIEKDIYKKDYKKVPSNFGPVAKGI